jgi:hypothetical protein
MKRMEVKEKWMNELIAVLRFDEQILKDIENVIRLLSFIFGSDENTLQPSQEGKKYKKEVLV